MDVVTLAVVGVALVGMGAFVVPRYLRTRRALSEPIGGDVCVACQSTQVTTLAPDCFRCDACRFTWGDGLAALAAKERQAKVAALSPEERKAYGIRELEEAASRLGAAEIALETASKLLVRDVFVGGGIGTGDMYSIARNEGVVQAAREMGLAQKHIRNASEALGGIVPRPGGEIQFTSELFALDAFFDSILVDVLGHAQVKKLQEVLSGMQKGVAGALAALAEPRPE